MGLEAVCRVESPAGAGEAKVLLETDSVIVRGGVRETIPFTAIIRSEVLGKRLILTHGGGQTTLHLGPHAARWARAESDLVFVAVETDGDLARLEEARDAMRQDGALWAIHPKGKGGVKDTAVFARAKSLGLVANKVAKFSETHTGERLVVPVARRLR